MFQTLPGLLTGFFEGLEGKWQVNDYVSNPSRASYRFLLGGFSISPKELVCFKPFQGFLPVSSGLWNFHLKCDQFVSNPSRASYRFLLQSLTGVKLKRTRFQTLPGLLTGFFFSKSIPTLNNRMCFKPFQGFLPVSSG